MNLKQIQKLQSYHGDVVEEYWKPRIPNKGYVDVFHFWELRQFFGAYLLDRLRPSGAPALSKEFLDGHERLASYSYTAFCRIAASRQNLDGLRGHIESRAPLSAFHVLNAFEAFYLFFGSALDNLAGVGNIILGHKCKEDSYSSFLKSLQSKTTGDQRNSGAIRLLEEAHDVKENYRDQVSHRSRLPATVELDGGRYVPSFESNFKKRGSATSQRSWRKTLREIAEGRCETLPADELCEKHLAVLEKAADTVFELCLQGAEAYLSRNSAMVESQAKGFDVDLTTAPKDASFILMRCEKEQQTHLGFWLHPICKKPIPNKCINSWCDLGSVEAIYYVVGE